MYFFVRYTGYVMLIFGVIFLLAGLGWAIYGFVHYEVLLEQINETLTVSQSIWRVQNANAIRFLTSISGLFAFVTGMFVAALGQLLLVFADIANQTRETNIILRSMRRRPMVSQARPVVYDRDQPVG